MNLFPENYDVSVTFAFTDLNGAPVQPSVVSAVLTDGEDQVVIDLGNLPFEVGATEKVIVVPAAFNALGVGELSAARILQVRLVTAAGVISRSSSYLIQGERRLSIMKNSFMTMEAAEILARDIPNLSGWTSASVDKRFAALISAFNRLTRISMRYASTLDAHLYRDHDCETIILANAWSDIDEDEFIEFPSYFRKNLRHAQLMEACDMMENETIASKHRAGIISETVGESSMMLRGNGLLDVGGISKRTLEYLTGHIYYNNRLTRA